MAITQKGDYYYGDNVADLKILLGEYSTQNEHRAAVYEQSVCICGGKKFVLLTNEQQGTAMRRCTTCNEEHIMIDNNSLVASDRLEEHGCLCEKQAFFLLSAIATQKNNTEQTSWYYLGGMCPSCKLIGVYADWEYSGSLQPLVNQV